MRELTPYEKANEFHKARLEHLRQDKHALTRPKDGKLVLHFIPEVSFKQESAFLIDSHIQSSELRPVFCNGYSTLTPTFDGWLVSSENGKDIDNYTLAFRNGTIESVNTSLFDPSIDGKIIPTTLFLKETIKSIGNYLSFYEARAIATPIHLFISLLELEGYALPEISGRRNAPRQIDRAVLTLPSLVLTDYVMRKTELKKRYDIFWNAFGLKECAEFSDAFQEAMYY